MFRLTRKPSSGSHNQYLAKITHLVQSGYVEVVQDVSFMVAYCDLWGVCTVHCVRVHTPHRSQYAAITLTTSCTAPTYLLLTNCVIFS